MQVQARGTASPRHTRQKKTTGQFHDMLKALQDNRFSNMELSVGSFNPDEPSAAIRLPDKRMVLLNLAGCNGDDLREALAYAKAQNVISDIGELVGIMRKVRIGTLDRHKDPLEIQHNNHAIVCHPYRNGNNIVYIPC